MHDVDDAPDTLTEAFWYDITEQALPPLAAPAVTKGRLARLFDSLVESMRLQHRQGLVSYGRQPALTASDIVAQNYPHLYLHVMC
jgi:hypothetical protein